MKTFYTVIFVCAYLLGQGQPSSAELIASFRKDLSSKNDSLRFRAHINSATHFGFVDGQQDSVLVYAERALKIANEVDNLDWKNTAYYYHGLYHYNYTQDFKKAIHFYEITKSGLIELGDNKRLPTIHNVIGSAKAALGDLEGAMADYAEVLKIAKDSLDYTTLSNTLSNTSIIYTQLGEESKAIEMLKESLEYNKKDTTLDQGYSYLNAALNLLDSYVRLDSMDLALDLVREIEPVADSLNYSIASDRLVSQKVNVLKKADQPDELAKVVENAYYSMKNSPTHNQNFQSVAYEFVSLQIRKGQRERALSVLKEIEAQTEQTSIVFQLNKYSGLFELNEQLGNYEEAIKYSKKYHFLKDSLDNVEKAAKVAELMKKYELAQKEAAIQQSELDKLLLAKKNSLLLSMLLAVLGLVTLAYLWYQRRRRKEQEEIYQLEQKMLSLQMNPHFIFNAISSIQNFLYDAGDAKKAILHLSTFASLMRQILENSREKFIPLEEEIDFLTNYLNLQRLRFDDRFDYEIIIDPEIDMEHISIPPLLTQPFVENAIEHGQIYNMPKGKLTIKIGQKAKNIIIDIVDNGVGIDSKVESEAIRLIHKKSLSISITKERLALLSKLMKDKFSLQINPNAHSKGTHVQLNIPSIYL